MNIIAAAVLGIGIAIAGILAGGIFQAVPVSTDSAAGIYVVNKFSGQVIVCQGTNCIYQQPTARVPPGQ